MTEPIPGSLAPPPPEPAGADAAAVVTRSLRVDPVGGRRAGRGGRGRRLPDPPAVRDHLARLGDAARLVGRADRRRRDVPARRQRAVPHRAGLDARPERLAGRDVVARSRPRRREAQRRGRVPERRGEPGVQHRADGPVAERRQVRRARPDSGTRCRPTRPQIRVVEVCRGAPAYGKLEPGDQVLAVDGNRRHRRRPGRPAGAGAPARRRRRASPTTATAPPAPRGRRRAKVSKDRRFVRSRRRARPRARPCLGDHARRSSPPINSRST